MKKNELWVVHVARSKKDQEGHGRDVFLPSSEALDRDFTLLKTREFSTLMADKSGKPWSRGAAASELKRLGILGKYPLFFQSYLDSTAAPHAFRRGGTTSLLSAGARQEDVQRRGRWKSQTSMTPYVNQMPALQAVSKVKTPY